MNITEKVTEFEKELNGIHMRAFHMLVVNSTDGKLTPTWSVVFQYEDDSYRNRLHRVTIVPTQITLTYKHCYDWVDNVFNLSKYDQCMVVFDDDQAAADKVFEIAMGFYNLMQTIKTNALW